MADETIELTEVQAVLDGLSSPTDEQFVQAVRGYSDGAIASAAAKLALAGGPGGGGDTAGASRVLGPFPFAFDDAGLTTGVTLYTPTVGDILVDAWIEVDEEWDGTTPFADIGTFEGASFGMFGGLHLPLDLTAVDGEDVGDGVLANTSNADANFALSAMEIASTDVGTGASRLIRPVPAKFVVANPLKVVVSQDGEAGGDDPGASQGSGAVYLIVATPSLT